MIDKVFEGRNPFCSIKGNLTYVSQNVFRFSKLLSMETQTNDDKGNLQNIIIVSLNLSLFIIVIYGKIPFRKKLRMKKTSRPRI